MKSVQNSEQIPNSDCSDVSTYDFRCTSDWSTGAFQGQHLFVDTNASGDFCYVNETECGKSGSKKKCTCCKMIVHTQCIYKVKQSCRPTFREVRCVRNKEENSNDMVVSHHWLHRKRQYGKCKQCSKSFQTKFPFNNKDIVAVHCSWCKVAYHNKSSCFSQSMFTEACSMGVHANIIMPPSCIVRVPINNTCNHNVQPKTRSSSYSNRSLSRCQTPSPSTKKKSSSLDQGGHNLEALEDEPDPCCVAHAASYYPGLVSTSGVIRPFVIKAPASNIKPLLVFINPKSGGNQGLKLLSEFQWLLNPRQVFDITDGGPKKGLELYGRIPNLRILACGGDGTAGWILSAIDSMKLNPCPPVGVLPLGTGNDLARTINWGGGYTDEPVAKILLSAEEGKTTVLDRWKLSTRLLSDELPLTPAAMPVGENEEASKDLPQDVFNNYFSLGADAATALEFHESREANPEKFNSRLRNKMFYMGAGGKDILKRSWKDLCDYVTITCDGVDISPRLRDLKCHCILFLNIPKYSAGTTPWGNPLVTGYAPQRIDDGWLEVIGLSSRSLATLQVGGHGERLCQCQRARLVTHKVIPMQVDGEPCKLLPSIIEIELRNKVNLIVKPKRRLNNSSTESKPILICCSNCSTLDGADQDPSLKRQMTVGVYSICAEDFYNTSIDKSKLLKKAQELGQVTLNADTDLGTAREIIQMSVEALVSESWVFLDSMTDGVTQIERNLEASNYLVDTCQDKLYILGMWNNLKKNNQNNSNQPMPNSNMPKNRSYRVTPDTYLEAEKFSLKKSSATTAAAGPTAGSIFVPVPSNSPIPVINDNSSHSEADDEGDSQQEHDHSPLSVNDLDQPSPVSVEPEGASSPLLQSLSKNPNR